MLTNLFNHSVPPDIDDESTSSDVVVNEGDDTSLVCKADGHPTPNIVWLREDKADFTVYDPSHNHSRRLTGKTQKRALKAIAEHKSFLLSTQNLWFSFEGTIFPSLKKTFSPYVVVLFFNMYLNASAYFGCR